jgi:thiol-disulfide isomerase/thioredoxin
MKAWVTLVIAAAAMAAGVAVYLQRETPPTEPAAPVASEPSSEPVGEPAYELVATLPRFQLVDRDGQLRSLQDWPDKALIVNFWATWCAPCRREIPLLQQIQREKAADGFQVIGIAVDFRDKVLAYADEMNIEYPLLIGEQDALDAAAAFGLDVVGLPFTVFTDRQGRVVVAHVGELTADEARLILGAVSEVDGGSMTPAEARRKIEAELPALAHEAGSEDG